MSTYFIVNPVAGKGLKNAQRKSFLSFIKGKEMFPEATFLFTSGHGDATYLAKHAQSSGAREIMVCGGDGTVSEIVKGLVLPDPNIRIGIIPLGTANDLARNLNIPLNPQKALRMFQDKRVRELTIDLGLANGERFVNTVSVGLDAEINNHALLLKPFFCKLKLPPAAYVPSFLRSVLRHTFSRRSCSASLYIDGKRFYSGSITAVAVTNSPSYGKVIRINPDARMVDGQLDLCFLRGISNIAFPFVIPYYALGLLTKKHTRMRHFTFRKFSEMQIVGKAMPLQIDGEDAGETKDLHISVLPAILNVFSGI